MKSYDTNAVDVPTTAPVGSHNSNAAIEESYSYDLWDADKTMGCQCDPGYYGADCSQKKCKYGVDPLFHDDTDGVIHQTTVVHLGSKGYSADSIGGLFNIVFYDVFGEKYTTKPIPADSTLEALQVAEAFEALPNGVISSTNPDVTKTAPLSVDVSVQASDGGITFEGGMGAGTFGGKGAGLGSFGDYGAEFTVRFKTNPGILKTIELDTRQVTTAGTTDHWVANIRQGQFHSRYTDTVRRVNTLLYGSKYLYTNEAPELLSLSQFDLIKVGGQEFMIADMDIGSNPNKRIFLNQPFLGASILPVLTDTGAIASAIDNSAGSATVTLSSALTDANSPVFSNGAMLWVQNHPLTSRDTHATGVTEINSRC